MTHGYTYLHLCKTHDQHANAMTKVENLCAFHTFAKVFFNVS